MNTASNSRLAIEILNPAQSDNLPARFPLFTVKLRSFSNICDHPGNLNAALCGSGTGQDGDGFGRLQAVGNTQQTLDVFLGVAYA
jgi:hypothetical protein